MFNLYSAAADSRSPQGRRRRRAARRARTVTVKIRSRSDEARHGPRTSASQCHGAHRPSSARPVTRAGRRTDESQAGPASADLAAIPARL